MCMTDVIKAMLPSADVALMERVLQTVTETYDDLVSAKCYDFNVQWNMILPGKRCFESIKLYDD